VMSKKELNSGRLEHTCDKVDRNGILVNWKRLVMKSNEIQFWQTSFY
jgi:hypothetical protein